jgi:hypothetical protein
MQTPSPHSKSIPRQLQSPTGSNYSSPITPFQYSPAGLLKQSGKKKQSELKSYINQFGNLLLTYLHDSNQIKGVVSSLASLYRNLLSVNRTFLRSGYWRLKPDKAFPELHNLCGAKMIVDIEASISQLRLFMSVFSF